MRDVERNKTNWLICQVGNANNSILDPRGGTLPVTSPIHSRVCPECKKRLSRKIRAKWRHTLLKSFAYCIHSNRMARCKDSCPNKRIKKRKSEYTCDKPDLEPCSSACTRLSMAPCVICKATLHQNERLTMPKKLASRTNRPIMVSVYSPTHGATLNCSCTIQHLPLKPLDTLQSTKSCLRVHQFVKRKLVFFTSTHQLSKAIKMKPNWHLICTWPTVT